MWCQKQKQPTIDHTVVADALLMQEARTPAAVYILTLFTRKIPSVLKGWCRWELIKTPHVCMIAYIYDCVEYDIIEYEVINMSYQSTWRVEHDIDCIISLDAGTKMLLCCRQVNATIPRGCWQFAHLCEILNNVTLFRYQIVCRPFRKC